MGWERDVIFLTQKVEMFKVFYLSQSSFCSILFLRNAFFLY